jgi:cell division protein FtsW
MLEHRVLVTATAGLCLLGLPIVLSASAVGSLETGSSAYSIFIKQAIFLGIGTVVAVVASRAPVGALRKLRHALPFGTMALLLAVLVPGVGSTAGGSSRWIGAGPIQLQPSELMKLGVILFAADLLARRAHKEDPWHHVVRPLLVFLAAAGMLIILQPDLGTCIVIACITFSLMFAAGVPAKLVFSTLAAAATCASILALKAPYRRDRLLSFMHPFAHAGTTGYQVVQSLVTLGQGGIRGNGVGGSVTTWGYLPNGHTDFIFAVIGGNLGLVGTLGVVCGFGALGWAGMRVAAREKDPFTRYVAIGITCWIVTQAVVNMGGVVDALPVTGIPLPFISYGGTALVLTLCGSGLLAGIARRQVAPPAVIVRAPRRARAAASAPTGARRAAARGRTTPARRRPAPA